MLNLSRKQGEAIVIPKYRVEIVVREIRGDTVKLGIAAPPDVDIFRHEVFRAICFDEWCDKDTGDE